jgi:hypothetical protein
MVAEKLLGQWCAWADESMIKTMKEIAKLLRRHEENILTYFDMPISNGIVEGLNNKGESNQSPGLRIQNFKEQYSQHVSLHGRSSHADYFAQICVWNHY